MELLDFVIFNSIFNRHDINLIIIDASIDKIYGMLMGNVRVFGFEFDIFFRLRILLKY